MSINEELSFTEYTLTEDTTDFIISFDRIGGSTDEVSILVNNTPIEDLVGYTVLQVNFSTWQVDPALPAGTVVRLARTTNLDKMVYVFTAGSKFIAKNVDDNFKQIQHSQQEIRDRQDKLEGDATALLLEINDVKVIAEQAAFDANEALVKVDEILNTGVVPAGMILTNSGQNQQQVNDFGGAKWYVKVGGYDLGAEVRLEHGDWVRSTVNGNTNNPNVDMAGWVNTDNGLSTVSELSSVSANDKNRIFVKNYAAINLALVKPYLGGGGGNFEFISDSLDTPDNVRTFAGIGGIWKRVNWLKPTIYDAGIIDESLDNTDKFKALLLATSNYFNGKKEIDLCGKALKVSDFIMYSNMYIINGGLDFTGSTVINSSNFAYAGQIVGENAPQRNLDPAVYTRYADLSTIKNFGFKDVYFKSPTATVGIRRNIMAFYKWENFKLIRCKFDLDAARAYKMVGGFANSNYAGLGLWDQPVPYGGFSKKAVIKFNEFNGVGYTTNSSSKNIMSDAGQFAAVSESEVAFNSYNNVTIGAYFDAFCKDSSAHHNVYKITDDMLEAFLNSSVASVCGVYIGQCAYNISAYKNRITNAVNHNIINEAASFNDIYSNTIIHTSALQALATTQANAITVQANIITDTVSGTTMTKGCEELHIYDNTAIGVRQGILVSTTHQDSARRLNVHDNRMNVKGSLAGLTISNVMDSDFKNNTSNGYIALGRALNCVIDGNKINSASNYALYLINSLKTGTRVSNNTFVTQAGSAIYNDSLSGESLSIFGGVIQSVDGSPAIQNGSGVGSVMAYNFENNVANRRFITTQSLNLAAGAKILIDVPVTGAKSGWLARAQLQSLGSQWANLSVDITVKAACKTNAVELLIQNSSASAINSSYSFLVELESYANNAFTN